eukprot:CAMPEP_0204381394 /NCGR_PEP_ID=MMETSP0469-20131031/54194_1 /ASSEMBLY_ACC=CAM_ASM_000384 /TAXON_ID=2969 /ORGANISM="Oxyrrhis marina" /LENGTH=54 /DNA_ID=CAMNT_0051373229 /DNA_START=27 /DNA_END=187 /DNA_ORIENTATION=+
MASPLLRSSEIAAIVCGAPCRGLPYVAAGALPRATSPGLASTAPRARASSAACA